MELPITIIIIFFIALVVGGAILAFATHSLNHAQQQLDDRWRTDPDNKDTIIEVQTATPETIRNLANACVGKNHGVTLGAKALCFALFASAAPDFASLNGVQLDDNFTLNTTGVPAGATAVRLTFDPTGHVLVTG